MNTKRKNPNRLAEDTELVSLYTKKPQANALRTLSRNTRIPQQVYLREGLAYILSKYKKDIAK
jgi:Ribbon-helix-helix domain